MGINLTGEEKRLRVSEFISSSPVIFFHLITQVVSFHTTGLIFIYLICLRWALIRSHDLRF